MDRAMRPAWCERSLWWRSATIEAALSDLDELAGRYPADREVWKTRARLLLRTGAARRAMADAETALRVDPEDASACWVLMIAAGEAGEADTERRARQCYEAFREDETQRQLARLRRDRSPADDLEAEPIHAPSRQRAVGHSSGSSPNRTPTANSIASKGSTRIFALRSAETTSRYPSVCHRYAASVCSSGSRIE